MGRLRGVEGGSGIAWLRVAKARGGDIRVEVQEKFCTCTRVQREKSLALECRRLDSSMITKGHAARLEMVHAR